MIVIPSVHTCSKVLGNSNFACLPRSQVNDTQFHLIGLVTVFHNPLEKIFFLVSLLLSKGITLHNKLWTFEASLCVTNLSTVRLAGNNISGFLSFSLILVFYISLFIHFLIGSPILTTLSNG